MLLWYKHRCLHGVQPGISPFSGQVLRAAMEGVETDAQMYPQTIHVDLGVAAMGVVTPEGQLIRTGAHLRHSPSTPALEGQSAPLSLSMTGCCATPACSHTQAFMQWCMALRVPSKKNLIMRSL